MTADPFQDSGLILLGGLWLWYVRTWLRTWDSDLNSDLFLLNDEWWLNSIPLKSFYSTQCSQQSQLNTIFTCNSTSPQQLVSSPTQYHSTRQQFVHDQRSWTSQSPDQSTRWLDDVHDDQWSRTFAESGSHRRDDSITMTWWSAIRDFRKVRITWRDDSKISDQGLFRRVPFTRRDDLTKITTISDHVKSDLDTLTWWRS